MSICCYFNPAPCTCYLPHPFLGLYPSSKQPRQGKRKRGLSFLPSSGLRNRTELRPSFQVTQNMLEELGSHPITLSLHHQVVCACMCVCSTAQGPEPGASENPCLFSRSHPSQQDLLVCTQQTQLHVLFILLFENWLSPGSCAYWRTP